MATRIFRVHPAWDRRSDDPEKDYGISDANMTMFVAGDAGAVQFVVMTRWHLPAVQKELDNRVFFHDWKSFNPLMLHKPIGTDVGHHSKIPMRDGENPIEEKGCEWTVGQPCYYDGSTLRAQDMLAKLIAEGSEPVWLELEEYYQTLVDRAEELANA